MLNELLDATLDSLKIFPFILLIYIVMELIESAKNKNKIEKALSGPVAPVVAGACGVIPECGFAVMVAKLYDKGMIKIGTLIGAFIAVSDEGLIVLLSNGKVLDAVILAGVKILYAVLVGEVLNRLLSKKDEIHICPNDGDCIECGEHHDKPIDKFFFHPLSHALKTFLFVLIFNALIAVLIYLIGDERISDFLNNSVYFQPLFSALVGLVPNCASSTMIAQAYVGGVLNFSGLIAGLSSNAGLGIIVLFKSKERFVKNVLILALLFLSAVIAGYLSLIFVL